MTSLEERHTAVDLDDLRLAAELVVASGYASQRMVQRKLRIHWNAATDILTALVACGVVEAPDDEGTYQVLVAEDALPDLLARLQAPVVEPDDDAVEAVSQEVVEPELVSLEKHRQESGGGLAVRPDDDLELRKAGEVVEWEDAGDDRQTLFVRARQATARGVVSLPDTVVVARTVAVTRQAPMAGVRLVVWTPRGAVRLAVLVRAWVRDEESLRLLAKHEAAGEGESYAKVVDARGKKNLAGRAWMLGISATFAALLGLAWWAPTVFAGILGTVVFLAVVATGRSACRDPKELGGLALAALALAWLAWWQGPDLAALIPQPPVWAWWVLAGMAVVTFGVLGRKEDQHLVEMPASMAGHKPPVVTAPMVIEALCSLGHSKMKVPEDIRVIMDPREAGAGTQIDLELPKGVPASYVVKNREPLAASMRWALGCVWPSVGLRHPGHLSLYISEQVMAEALQKPWPLASAAAVDIFNPQPQVTDQRGDWVDLTLAYASVVIGAQPRMGKTFFLRQLLLVAGLDVRTKVASLDGKGTGDLAPTRLFADFYSVGDDPEEIEDRVLSFLREVRADMRRRAKFIRGLSHDEAPESKVTSELVDRYPHILAPRVIGMDETQSYFGYGEKKNKAHAAVRDEITAIVTDLVKRGPALGIWVFLATQNVCEETIPRQISLNAVLRAALKLFDDSANNMVLGAGAYGKGVDATQFDFTDKGLMWMRGDGDRPFIGRSVVGLDAVAAERIAAKARALRVKAGRLTGEAADDGIEDAVIVVNILDDAGDALVEHQRQAAQYAELLEWLKEMRPDHYADLDVKELSARMPKGPDGNGAQVWSNGKNARGVRLDDLRKRDDGQ